MPVILLRVTLRIAPSPIGWPVPMQDSDRDPHAWPSNALARSANSSRSVRPTMSSSLVPKPERSHDLAKFLGDEEHEVDYMLRFSG